MIALRPSKPGECLLPAPERPRVCVGASAASARIAPDEIAVTIRDVPAGTGVKVVADGGAGVETGADPATIDLAAGGHAVIDVTVR